MPKERIALQYTLEMKEKSAEAELNVYGYIYDTKWDERQNIITAKEFEKTLKDAKAKGAKKLHMRVNSGGGDVYQAVAMRTMLMDCGMDIDVRIEGLCASAATLLCCIPDANVSISEGSSFMIHNPMTGCYGNAADMDKTADFLRKMESDFHAIYAKRCGRGEEEVKDWMDAETWFTAQEAVESGFCDSVFEGKRAAASAEMAEYMKAVYMRVPENITVSNDGQQIMPLSSENTQSDKEENEMDFKDITLENLREGNAEVFNQIMQAGAAQERERIADIDDLTTAGYEAMAKDAKESGMSAMDFHKAIVKAQREKGAAFIQQREAETKPAAQVTGGDSGDNDAKVKAEAEEQNAKDVAAYAKAEHADNGGMY